MASNVMQSFVGTNAVVRGSKRKLMSVLVSALILSACSDSPESMVESAKGYLRANDINAASIQLKNALQAQGDLAEARFLLGRVNLQQGDISGALKELRRAAELGHKHEEIAPLLAEALFREGSFDQVLTDYVNVTLPDTDAQVRLLGAVGGAYLGKADPAAAARTFEAALALMPEDVPSRINLGRAKLALGDAAGALEDAQSAVLKSPEQAEGHMLLADVHLLRNQPDLARQAMEAAVKAQPNVVSYRFALVSFLLRFNDFDAAGVQLQDMKRLAAGHPTTKYVDAYLSFRNNKLDEARAAVLDVVKTAPGFLPGQLLAGAILLRQNDHGLARTHLQRVLEQVPGQPLARRLLAASYLSANEPGRALEVLTPILAALEQDPDVMALAGQTYLANGDLENAERYLRKAAELSPNDARAHTRLGVARMAGGETERAFADLALAARMDEASGQADLTLILAYVRQGQFDKALAAQQALEKKLPDSPQTYNLKGGILLGKRDLAGARQAFERAIQLQPDFLAAAVNLARLDLADKQPDRGRGHFSAIVTRNPKNVDALLAMAEYQQAAGDPANEILKTLERAQEAGPTALAPKLALVQLHLRNREPVKAAAVARSAVALQPNDPRAVEALARALQASGDTQQAVVTLNRLTSLMPRSPQPYLLLADVHFAAKDIPATEQALGRALQIAPDLIEAQVRLAGVQLERRDQTAALSTIKTMQQQRPDFAPAYVLEGDVLVQTEKWSEATTAYRKAYDLNKRGEIVNKLHIVLTRAGRAAEADRLMDDWLKSEPKDVVARGYLAEKAIAERRFADAVRLYRQLSELSPNNPLLLNNLAWSAAQLKDAKALEYAKQALDLAPDNPVVLDTVGVIQIDLGRTAEGLANLERAVSLGPNLVPLQLNLAKAYIKVERKADARKTLDALMPKLQADTPTHQEASRLLGSL